MHRSDASEDAGKLVLGDVAQPLGESELDEAIKTQQSEDNTQ